VKRTGLNIKSKAPMKIVLRNFRPSGPALFPELTENPWPTEVVPPSKRGASKIRLRTLELCAGAGGQALGYEQAGIEHAGLIEFDKHACATLRLNRPDWNVIEQDLNTFSGKGFERVDIISGGLPCPPFSVAGKQLGKNDERNLFPAMVRLVDQLRPQAVMIENVRGILDPTFRDYRIHVAGQLRALGYETGWKLMNASDFGVPQLRPRVVFIAIRAKYSEHFVWPEPAKTRAPSVGEVLSELMASRGWKGAKAWAEAASQIAPTIVGGSHKHGGPDLGPTRARRAWQAIGVDGLGIANEPPEPEFGGLPRLTARMVARLQGFPDTWHFSGGKTAACRQIGNAFPPPFARAVAENLRWCLTAKRLVAVPA
jgi:DNA (cytosine-5)-methyltransferase 1